MSTQPSPWDIAASRVAVTGGAGMIGSHVCDQLVAAGARVVVIDDFSKGRRENLARIADRVEVREGDLEDAAFAEGAFHGCDTVFHLASRAYGVGYAEGRHLDILQHNERVTNNLFRALAAAPPRRILLVSSSCVYRDDGPDTIVETTVPDGEPEAINWGYGWSKRFLEQKGALFSRATDVPVTIVRPFNVYGERYRWVGQFSQAMPMLAKRVFDGEDPVTIWGSGRQRRSYIHAHDCARMMIGVLAAGSVAGPVNLGTPETVSMTELVALLCRAGGLSPRLEYDLAKPEGRFVKSADTARFCAIMPDFRLAIGLEEGLARMRDWYVGTFAERQAS